MSADSVLTGAGVVGLTVGDVEDVVRVAGVEVPRMKFASV